MDADSEELAHFREQWKAEVKQRTNPNRVQNVASAFSLDENVGALPSGASIQRVSNPLKQYKHSSGGSALPVPETHSRPSVMPTTELPRALVSAVQTYRLATRYEQAGNLDEALRFYQKAFRIDSNVDKAYRREEQRLEALGSLAFTEHPRRTSFEIKEAPLIKAVPRTRHVGHKRSDSGILLRLVSSFPADLQFEPLDEANLAPLRRIPDEIVILILKMLDPHSIETFALLSRKARILSLDSSIWRDLVQRTYLPPQIPDGLVIDILAEQYMFDYRRLYVEHPRLRLDGVYIAVCHYVRSGLNADNVWVRVSHLITYHRFLRFFSDGTVISLLANEDVEPQTIIPLLQSSLRMKGLFIGTWSLEGTTLLIRDLVDPSGRNARYAFQMTLTLKSKPLGRWNKLDLDGYDSVNKENGEAIPLGLKHERPFWFSKVRSYVA